MKNLIRSIGFLCLMLIAAWATAQTAPLSFEMKALGVNKVSLPQHAQWTVTLDQSDIRAGESANLKFHAKIDPGFHMYALKAGEGPSSMVIEASKGGNIEFGTPIEAKPMTKFDKNFEAEVKFFEGTAEYTVPIKIKEGVQGEQTGTIAFTYQMCDDKGCLPPDVHTFTLKINVADGEARSDRIVAMGASNPPSSTKPPGDKDPLEQGLWLFLGTAALAGLATLITPCVFPMLPITVSFFSKNKPDGRPAFGVKGAIAYCLGIIATFTLLGVGITVLFGATSIQQFANNIYLNISLAVLFVVLALSLFGVYEIMIPSGLANKFQRQGAQSTSLVGPLFMGFAFSITTFTCSGPFVGTILLAAANSKSPWMPLLGMLVFSITFALPFFLLALFPNYLSNLPKSGSWLATFKAFMGFIELAAAVKFLSNADLQAGRGFLTQSVFLTLWAAIFLVGGFYLLGWLKLPKENEIKVGNGRRLFGGVFVALSVYVFLAVNGTTQLGNLFNPLLPPDPYPYQNVVKKQEKDEDGWIHNMDDALAQAKEQGKPVLIDFTGVNCTNCRWMEKNIFTRDDVKGEFKNFVLAKLYTDRATDAANAELQKKYTDSVTLPVYAIVTPEGTVERVHSYEPDVATFLKFLSGS